MSKAAYNHRLLLVSSLAAIAFSSPVLAQSAPAAQPAAEQPNAVDAPILVTGSRIARRTLENASPIQILDSKQLDARGFDTIAQALNEQPTFGVPGASPVGFNQSNLGAGQSFVNFLGLGSQRTLTLVNGRRFVSSNTASIFGPTGAGGSQVDLNVIPTKLIDRVETVAAIGAPIYGSDAVAGTINIILKKNFQGIDLDVQSGVSSVGDTPEYRIRGLVGKNFGGGRGNITISGEYSDSKGLLYNQRPNAALDNRFDQTASGKGPQPIYNDLRVPSVDPSGVIAVGGAIFGLDFPLSPQQSNVILGDPAANFGVTNAQGQQLRFAPNGTLIPIDFGNTVGTTNGFNVFTSGGNGYSLRSVENLITDLMRYNVSANLSYDLTDNLRFFGEAWYSVSQGKNLASQPVYNSGLFGAAGTRDGSLIIPLSNPFLSQAARAAIQAGINNNPYSDQNFLGKPQNYFYLGRASTDLSPGVSTGRSEVLRFVGGLDGTVSVLKGKEWKFEAYLNYGRALVTSKNPELNEQNFLNALNATTNGSGAIVCAPGYTNSPIATVSSTCAPLNPFGNQISQAAKDYVTTIATPRNLNTQLDAVASISGPLVTLPGGNLAFALGYEHRAETTAFDPGAFYYGAGTGDSSQRTSYGRSVPFDPISGRYHTNEVFGELNADLVSPENHVPFIYNLSIQTAGRYIWHSFAGNDPTYTFQARYAPVRDIAFRAAYTRAVRAPSITESFNPTSSSYGFAVDVCDQSLSNQGPNAATRSKNCAAAGVPSNFTSLSNQRSFQTFSFGNPVLKNEKADSFTVGTVFTPTFLPGFNTTVDFIDITLKDAISQFSNDLVVSSCYDSTSYPNNPFCALVGRDPTTHQLNSVGSTYFNSAKERYRGIVAAVDYRHATDFLGKGSVTSLNVSYQYLISRTSQVTAGSNANQLDNSVGYSPHKGVATVGYANGPFFGQVQLNYIGSVLTDPNLPYNFYSVPKVGAFTYVNMNMSLKVAPRFTLRTSIDNVFNAKAPYPYPASGGTTTYFQGILGTFIRVGAEVAF
jgi:outer membrane receptor protein involved in Fe transport